MFTHLMVIIYPIIGMAGNSGDLEGGVGRMGTWLGMVRGGGTGGRLAGGRLWILLNAELKVTDFLPPGLVTKAVEFPSSCH